MIVTVTNVSLTAVYISAINKQLAPGELISFSRSVSEMDRETSIRDLVVQGKISLAFSKEAGDEVSVGFGEKISRIFNCHTAGGERRTGWHDDLEHG